MDQSFELLSSMSPKRVWKQKLPRKGATLLALKKNIRRSSIFENASLTIKNENLFIVESNVTESTTNSVKSTESLPRDVYQTTIIISDTDESFKSIENNEPLNVNENVTTSTDTEKNNKLLPDEKLEDIKRWIASVDIQRQKSTDVSTFSEVSTIYGDENLSKFIPKVKGSAVNSTFVDETSKKFDELFEKKYTNFDIPSSIPSNGGGLEKTIRNITVDDSQKLRENIIYNKPDIAMKSTPAFNKYQIDLLSNNVSNPALDGPKTGRTEMDNETDLKCMLDSLYGEQWRKKEDLILPKTEPRKNNVLKNYNVTNSERQPKTSPLYKNPYLEIEKGSSKGLLKNLQTSRLKANLESPLLTRLKLLCDSDSSSEKSSDDQIKPQTLNFNDSSDEHSSENRLTSKYFKKTQTKLKYLENGVSNKENIKLIDKNEVTDKPNVKKKIPKPGKIKCNPAIDVKRSETLKLNKESRIINVKSDTASSNSSTNKKTDKRISTSDSNSISISSDEEWDKKIDGIHRSSLANGTYSFLESLSGSVPIVRCDMAARIYRSNFRMHRDKLLDKLFKLYNEHIFNYTIPHDTVLEWNDRMRGTAGFCYCKKITRRTGAIERSVRIVLASKVVDSADRLRDTLVHEMCHAATWVVNCISDGHGTYWKAWALKAMKTFPELPPIKRCHDYVINTKYTYKCTGCGYSIGRHTKSLDIERKRCGHCYGKFELLINKTTKKGDTKSVAATPKKAATGFALFVKENYGIYKNPSTKHGDVMKILGQKFQEMKVKN